MEGKTFLSITEAAAYMGVTRPSIYARIKSGVIVPVRFGTRSQRIPIDQLTSNTKRTIQPNKGDFSSITTVHGDDLLHGLGSRDGARSCVAGLFRAMYA